MPNLLLVQNYNFLSSKKYAPVLASIYLYVNSLLLVVVKNGKGVFFFFFNLMFYAVPVLSN